MHSVNPYLAAPGDPSANSVVVLAHFDGADLSSSLVNSVPGGPAITPLNSNCRISTTQSVFGGASLRVQSSSDADIASGSYFAFGTGDFTIEFRYRPDAVSGDLEILDFRPSAPTTFMEIYQSGSSLRLYVEPSDRITSASGVLAANTWAAIAVSRNSGTTRMFVNGTQVGSNYTDANNYGNSPLRIGKTVVNTAPTTGYWDELRITKGVGRYAANYTIATTPFTL